MSAKYGVVGWNQSKIVYDLVVVAAIALYLTLFMTIGVRLQQVSTPLDDQTLAIRAYGSCAFLMLSLVLAIGPLARLDRRFLPLLYNRRHLGVMTAAVALGHAAHVLGWYFAYSPLTPLEGLLAADTSFGQLKGFPFIVPGMIALVVLMVLAATSHDFWLAFLTPPTWKALHMAIYPAYGLVVVHVALGALQAGGNLPLAGVVMVSAGTLTTLHLIAGFKERARDADLAVPLDGGVWVDAGPLSAIAEDKAVVVHLGHDEPVAIFRHQGKLSAITNLCAHQNGPLGEGRVVDGCITCPWHGFQYRLEDGCAPAPFTERIATYRVKCVGDRVYLDPHANPPGTYVEPFVVSGEAAP
jgi:nitrite reductase/ring-hydroxylating ferredoxin subunit/DMSO/TMAO reductase YedYZ heme-binding membrane subunit